MRKKVRLTILAALVGILVAACTSPTSPPSPDPEPPDGPKPDPNSGFVSQQR